MNSESTTVFIVLLGIAALLLFVFGMEAMVGRWFARGLVKEFEQGVDYWKVWEEKFKQATVKGNVLLFAVVVLAMGLELVIAGDEMWFYKLFGIAIVIIIFRYVIDKEGSARRSQASGVRRALRELVVNGQKGHLEAVADVAVRLGGDGVRVHVITAMKDWGGHQARKMMDAVGADNLEADSEPVGESIMTYARETAKQLKSSERTLFRGDDHAHDLLAQNYQLYRRLGQASAHSDRKPLEEFLLGERLKDYPYYLRMQQLQAAFPHLICEKCRVRAERFEGRYYQYVRCKRCQKSEHLLTGVECVTGIVGEEQVNRMEGATWVVSLWNADDNVTSYAEVDALRFSEGNIENPDWIIASILETLNNHLPEEKKPIPLETAPPNGLSKNALLQLERLTFFPPATKSSAEK